MMEQNSRAFGSATGFGVLADDLTGAMDTGVAFTRAGLRTVVSFATRLEPEPAVLVVTTDSRADEPLVAARRVRRAARRLKGRYVYKKIDSTLRGNIGVEIRAALETLSLAKAVVSPAFPESKRTVLGGRLLVDGKPLEATAFARDAASPVLTSYIPGLLENESGLKAASIGLPEVEKGPRHISRRLADMPERLIVVDAVAPVHLKYLAEALAMTGIACLPCGSAGLALALPGAFGYGMEPPEAAARLVGHGPVLAVVGSRHEAARRQIAAAIRYLETPLITVQPDEMVSPAGRLKNLSRPVREAASFINSGRSVIISSVASRYLPAGQGLAARLLARVAGAVIERAAPAGLFLSGGDIAREVARRLGIAGIGITGELEPGVVLGETMGLTRRLNVVTKAGGFGSELALAGAIYYLERNEPWSKEYPC